MMRFSFRRFGSAAILAAALLALLPGEARPDPRKWGPEAKPIRQGLHLEWQRASFRDPVSGKTLIVWSDTRWGTRDVYGQMLSPDGTQLWGTGGQAIVIFDSRQEDPEVVKVIGGWIVAWIDFRIDSLGDIWAQKLDDNGNKLWGDSGVLVDQLPDSAVQEMTLRAAHDGQGGAIIAWEDLRSGDAGDILAQRVTSSGTRAWTNPLGIARVNAGQVGITAEGDGNGNLLVAWTDSRGVDEDIYVAKITPSGTTPWGVNGMPVCTTGTPQTSVKLCADGQGGCYLAWQDRRNSTIDLYMQRMDSSGQAQWAMNGIALCQTAFEQSEVRVATSFNGTSADGLLTVWKDARTNGLNFEVYGQKINPAGAAQWTANGVKICGDAVTTREGGRLTSDLAGGMVCAWEDTRDTDGILDDCDLYAGRVLANGTVSWNGVLGTRVSSGPGAQGQPLLRMDSGDGAFVVFADTRRGSQLLRYMNLNLTNGAFTLDSVLCEIVYGLDKDADKPRIAPMTNGKAGIVWVDNRYAWGGHGIFYQVIDSTGTIYLPVNGDTLAPDNGSNGQYLQDNPAVCADGMGGFFTIWEDSRSGINFVRMSHVNSENAITCSRAGDLVSEQGYGQTFAFCAPDWAGRTYVAWSGFNTSFVRDIYITLMDQNCQAVWAQPIQLTNTGEEDALQGITATPDSCCIIVWKAGPDATSDIRAAKLNQDGTVLWNVMLCNATGPQIDGTIVADGQNGAYFAWSDLRSSDLDLDIYAQHVDAQGNILWQNNGLLIISEQANQNKPQLAVDSRGHCTVIWNDYRDFNNDLYGQKLNSNGTFLWPVDGKPICTFTGEQTEQALFTDAFDGLYLAWSDEGHSNYCDVYGMHYDSTGAITDSYWPSDTGGVICNMYDDQRSPMFAMDGRGGAFCVFIDERASGKEPLRNIWANRINDETVPYSIRSRDNEIPQAFKLEQNYPNPFNPTTRIVFNVPNTERVELTIFNSLGQRVTTLVDRVLTAGEYEVTMDAKRLASGMYYYRLKAGRFEDVKKMTLVR
jgi:hypothetical protein